MHNYFTCRHQTAAKTSWQTFHLYPQAQWRLNTYPETSPLPSPPRVTPDLWLQAVDKPKAPPEALSWPCLSSAAAVAPMSSATCEQLFNVPCGHSWKAQVVSSENCPCGFCDLRLFVCCLFLLLRHIPTLESARNMSVTQVMQIEQMHTGWVIISLF